MYKWFNRSVILEHLIEGQVINHQEYIKQLEAFKFLGLKGTYIIEKTYIPHNEQGFHYYKLDTLMMYLTKCTHDMCRIKLSDSGCLTLVKYEV